MKKRCLWICPALALALASTTGRPAAAQQVASGSLSAAARAMIQSHQSELAASARIYGYNLATGSWAVEQSPCAAMPDTILLRYHQEFPDGAESLFVAAVSPATGRIHIVPVLYRGATPFVPAPTNPRNIALFNHLVGESFSKGASLALSACYTALTGARVNSETGAAPKVAIAGAPAPTVHLEPQGKLLGVTLATRESPTRYKLWTLSLNQAGRVTSVTTKDQPTQVPRTAVLRSLAVSEGPVNPAPVESQAAEPVAEPGWEFIPHPSDPPSKIIPPAPQPPVILTPEP